MSVESSKALRKGEGLSMDYGPDRLDNSLLLDYGVLDTAAAKVGAMQRDGGGVGSGAAAGGGPQGVVCRRLHKARVVWALTVGTQ